MTKLYHYTHSNYIENIKEKGLFNYFGLCWFTKDSNGENTAYGFTKEKGRIVVELDDSFTKVSTYLMTEEGFSEMSNFFNPLLVGYISNVNNWYFCRNKIKPEKFLSVQKLINEEWVDI